LKGAFYVIYAVEAIMKDAGGQSRIGVSLGEYIDETLWIASAP
jgi:hypothetical protein